MPLLNIKLDIEESYKKIIKQYLYLFSSFIFIILFEPNSNVTMVTLFLYNILGMLFHNLILKEIILIE